MITVVKPKVNEFTWTAMVFLYTAQHGLYKMDSDN